ncbi:MAG TPA: NUDIX hydrolase [Acidimicrobiales bacterium]|nr:NUDIX hydrolase [Acidimicrobiales bacterium]
MRWTVHGERELYGSDWMRLVLVDVEVPGADRFEHHVVRYPHPAAGTVVRDPDAGVLLLWRHRFTTDTWGWEVPAGRVEEGETPEETARRETLEETGWRPGPLHRLGSYSPSNGSSDQVFHLYLADGATYVGEPADASESERIAWVPATEVRRLATSGAVNDGLSLTSLLWALALDAL